VAGEHTHHALPHAARGEPAGDANEPVTEPPWGSA
jgi:hypothetical protein